MIESIKAHFKKIARITAEWPIVGRFVKIGVAIIKLPELRDACIALNHRQHVLEAEQIPALQAAISALGHRQHVLEAEQIPALQATVSALNQRQSVFEAGQIPSLAETISALSSRQIASNSDRDNLVQSVPVALRKITRELAEIRERLDGVTSSNGRHKG